uniref:Uncharacterized protein n=1 Tax=viral metagenome TaxID=1070528 RepID=A0A6C0K9R8_9ZZZZ
MLILLIFIIYNKIFYDFVYYIIYKTYIYMPVGCIYIQTGCIYIQTGYI